MKTIYMRILCLLHGLLLVSAARLEPAPFNKTAYNRFVDCARNVSNRYNVAIENGQVLIRPPPGQRIDIDSRADRGLWRCMSEVCEYLNVAVESDRYQDPPERPIDRASAQWAEAEGAQGLNKVYGPFEPRPDTQDAVNIVTVMKWRMNATWNRARRLLIELLALRRSRMLSLSSIPNIARSVDWYWLHLSIVSPQRIPSASALHSQTVLSV